MSKAKLFLDFPQQPFSHLTWCLLVGGKIAGDIDEGFIDGIDKNILLGKVPEEDPIDFRRVVDVELHPRYSRDELVPGWYLMEPATVLHALLLEGG